MAALVRDPHVLGQEARAKQSLLERTKQFGREGAIEEIVIPEEDVVEVVKGQRRTSKRKFLPGYLLVRMELDDELWHIVKNTAKISGFVGSGLAAHADPRGRRPPHARADADLEAQAHGQFEEGEDVRVIHGPFSNFSGAVGEVKPEKEQVQVLVAVFGRATPVWLSYEHVEKV